MKSYPLLASRIFNTPLMIHPAQLDAILAGLGERFLGQQIEIVGDLSSTLNRPAPQAFLAARGEWSDNGYQIIDGVGVIDISGVLAHRSTFDMNTCSRIVGYDRIATQVDAALADSKVQSILLNMDTPGGEVAGVFDLADKIRGSRGIKPIAAVASDMAASAGYLIGSAADRLAVTQTGIAGSIGVVMRHVDASGATANQGLNVTFIYAGAHKVDGNPFQPLPDGVRADFQARVNSLYGLFVDAVAMQRGMTPESVRATEAAIFSGSDAVQAGLADLVATPDQMIEDMRGRAGVSRSSRAGARATHSNRSKSMGDQEISPGAASDRPGCNFNQADVDRARAEGHAEGMKDGVKQERERVSGIMGHAEASGREQLAQTCISQGLSIEQAGALMVASPKSGAAAGGSEFAKAMAGMNPGVKPAEEDVDNKPDANALIKSMVSMANAGRV